jgi:hypothetical protein
MGCHDAAAIRHLLAAEQMNRPLIAAIAIGDITRFCGNHTLFIAHDVEHVLLHCDHFVLFGEALTGLCEHRVPAG